MITFSAAWAAAGLNPYAYKLEFGGQTDNNRKMILKYWLNAPASSVSIEVSYMDGGTPKVFTFAGTTNEGENSVEVSTIGLPANTPLSWSVTAAKTSPTSPTKIDTHYSMYCPHGVAVVTNPYSKNFGRIFATETLQGKPGSSYISSKDGKVQAGIYTFSPQFVLENSNGVKKGNKDFTQQLPSFNGFDGGHQPYQIKISEDDRIFVSCADKRSPACVVWELDTTDLNTLTPIVRHISVSDFNSDYKVLNGNTFFSGFNCSMDVKGKGDNLTLLLYSTTKKGVELQTPSEYRLDEYKIGKKNKYNDGKSITITNISSMGGATISANTIVYDRVRVIYDGSGGYWYAGSRNTVNDLTLLHVNSSGTAIQNTRNTSGFFGGAGVMLHKTTYSSINGHTLLFKGLSAGKIGVWDLTGNASVTSTNYKWAIANPYGDTNYKLYNDYAVDYAENLFVVDNRGERIMAFALPYSGTKTTPATTTFTLEGQLNPFAYNLYTTQEDDGRIALHFFLNANADRVLVRLIDEKGNKYLLRDYPRKDSDKNYVPYNDDGFKTIITKEDIDSLNLPLNGTYTWEVEVNGNSVDAPTELPMSYGFYHPSSVDIDNNPENESFGLIIANEAMHKVTTMVGATVGSAGIPYSEYASYKTGAGIYAFTPAFEAIKNGSNYGFNGGNQFDLLNAAGVSTGSATAAAYAPRRVRFSEDGRLFVTSLNPITNDNKDRNAYLWEVNPKNLNSWNPVFQEFTIGDSAKLTIGDQFMAGPNTGFDVKGSGENLKLLMLSSNTGAMHYVTDSKGFRLDEYDLGTSTSWNQTPSRSKALDGKVVNYRGTQIEYDNDGGFWLCQYRVVEKEGEPTLLYFDANGEIKFSETFKFRGSGAIRFNRDFSKLIITGEGEAKATIYSVTKNANGVPTLTKETEIPMPTLGKEINDFAFDYAGNLYACANTGEKLVAYAMPYSGTVITPAAGRFGFKFTAAYQDAQLNPYAYRLKAEVTPKDSLKIFYNINADAERLQVYFTDTHTSQDYLVRDYPSDPTATVYRDGYMDMIREKDVDYFNIPRGVPMDWRVEVHGKSPIKPVKPSLNVIPFYAPNSVAIDTCPESPYFGRVLVVETQHEKFTGESYYSSFNINNSGFKNQAGIYAFMPELVQKYWKYPAQDPRWAPWDGRQVYNGNKNFTSQLTHSDFFKSGQQPWMVRISDDGRVFVSAMDDREDNAMVWELSQDLNSWTTLIESDRPSCSMDVKGSGEDLKLLIYSTDADGMEHYNHHNYLLHEYAIGHHKNTSFSGTPTQISHFGSICYGRVSYNAKVMYDKETDGFWFGGSNTNDTEWDVFLAYAHNNQGTYTQAMKKGHGDVLTSTLANGKNYAGGSGVNTHMINNEKILFKGVDGNILNFFKVTYDNNGVPSLEDKNWGIQLNEEGTCRCSDFAVDYANNLYFTDGNNKQLMTVALPYSGHVATPASSREQIIIPILADERSGVEAAPHVTQVDRAIVYRRLQADMCNTICLPFAITDKSKTPYANATFYEFTALTQGNDQVELQFNEVQQLEAGKPYLILPQEDIVDTVRFRHYGEFVDFVTRPSNVSWTLSNGTRITYHGVLAPTTIPEGALMVVANNRLAKASQAGQMQGLRGYFTVKGTMPSKAVLSFKQGTTTDDKTVVTPLPSTEVRKVLQDQQVFIIKDNEAYNILGEAVTL